MRSVVVFIFITFLSCTTVSCQEKAKNNLIFLEAAGASYDGVGFGYERYFRLNRLFRTTTRGGVAFAGENQAIAPFIGGSLLFGKQSNIEFGFNALFNYEDIEVETVYEYPSIDGNEPLSTSVTEKVVSKNLVHTLLGYRLQSKRSGIMFRVFITLPNQLNIWGYPNAGIAIGVAL